MKKSLSIILIAILIIGGILAAIPSKVYGYSAGMSASSRNVTVDDTVSVTVSLGVGVSAAQFGFSYSSNLELTGRSIGDLHSGQFGFFGANNVRSVTFTFKAKSAGTATVSASGVSLTYDYTDENGNPATKYGEGAGSASTTITINPKPTPTPTANPTPVPTQQPQQPEPTREPDRPNENDKPQVTDTPEEPTQTPTPTPEPTEEPNNGEQNETNEITSNETTNNETDNNNNKEKAPNKIIKIDEEDVITIKNEENDVMIKAKPIAIKEENVTLSVSLIEEETERYNDLTKMTQKIKGNKKFYDIKLLKDGLAVEPNGYVTVYLPIPEGYNKKRLEAYSINEQTEKTEKRTGEVQGNYYTFTTDKLEAFVLVEKEEPSKANRLITMILMLLGAIAILAIIIVIVKKIH